ncbi:hypothetical protein RB595_003685 [Gaeumannomyces hyphopodioides]
MTYIFQCNEWRLLQELRPITDQRISRYNPRAPGSLDSQPSNINVEQFDAEVRGLLLLEECPCALSAVEFDECERKLKGVCELLDRIVHPRIPEVAESPAGYSRLRSLITFLRRSDPNQTVDLISGSCSALFKPPYDTVWLKAGLALVADCKVSLGRLFTSPAPETTAYPTAKGPRRKTWKDAGLRRQATSALGAVFGHLECETGHEVMLNVSKGAGDEGVVPTLDLRLSSCPDSTCRPGARPWLEVRTGSLHLSGNDSVEEIRNICLDLRNRGGEALVLVDEQYGLYYGTWTHLRPSPPSSAPPNQNLDELISNGAFKRLDLENMGSPSLRYKIQEKRALAVRLGYCLMDFFDADLRSQRIYHCLGSKTTPHFWAKDGTLYLSFVSSLPATADPYNFPMGHPTLTSFAKLLLEIDFGQRLDFCVNFDDYNKNIGTWANLMDKVCRLEQERNDSYLRAVTGCLMVHRQISGALKRLNGADENDVVLTIQKELYEEVVKNLEIAFAESTDQAPNKRQRSESPEPIPRKRPPFEPKSEQRHADPLPREHPMRPHRGFGGRPPSKLPPQAPTSQEIESTAPSQRCVSGGVPGLRFTGLFDDSTPWEYSEEVCRDADQFIQRHRDLSDKFTEEPGTTARIKVAILDTGLDLTHPTIKNDCRGRIKEWKSWLPGRAGTNVCDASGHGTHVAALLLDIAPESDVYIAQIADAVADADPQTVSPHQIAEAVRHAVMEWQVDIITMSFGFQDEKEPGCRELAEAIRFAHASKVLTFAAASNVGAHAARPAFPARMSEVFCIYSGDGMGTCARTCPTASGNHFNFLTLGEAVESAWPRDLCQKHQAAVLDGTARIGRGNPCAKTLTNRKSGTSFATPIAAGIAAFLLLYAAQTLPEERAKILKEHDKMEDFLYHLSSKRGGYDVLSITDFFKRREEERKMMLESLLDGRPWKA